MMPSYKDNRFILSRRNFVMAMFMSPFYISKLMADSKTVEIDPSPSNNEEGFVILGGWVLLKDDLIGNVG